MSQPISSLNVRPRIWFNKNLSSTNLVIQAIRRACRPEEQFFFVCSHTRSNATVAPVADLFEIEPTGLGGAGYVAWCLDFVQRHQIDVFIPRNYAAQIAGARASFEALGVKLILAADRETLALIANKAEFYEALGGDLVPQPAYRVVSDVEQFKQAFAELSAHHNKVCYKPTEGIGGKGFKILTVNEAPIYSTWDQEQLSIEFDDAVSELSAKETFPELMLMEFLPGQERSVDCLADKGRLLAAITRLKSWDGKDELLEDNPLLVEYSRLITDKIRLDGLYNVQFMESSRGQYLLEVNARMSGGIHYGAHSGVCLPYWAIRLALGTAVASDIPSPQLGIRIERSSGRILA